MMEVRLLNGESNIAVVVDNTLNNKGITKVTFNERKQDISPYMAGVGENNSEIIMWKNIQERLKEEYALGIIDPYFTEELKGIIERG